VGAGIVFGGRAQGDRLGAGAGHVVGVDVEMHAARTVVDALDPQVRVSGERLQGGELAVFSTRRGHGAAGDRAPESDLLAERVCGEVEEGGEPPDLHVGESTVRH